MSMVCPSCKTGLLVFQQTGHVRFPDSRVYKCAHCGNIHFVHPKVQ